MVRIVQALGTFALFGALFSTLLFPLVWILTWLIVKILPFMVNYFNLKLNPDFNEIDLALFIGYAYGFSWFSGLSEAWRAFKPSQLDLRLKEIRLRNEKEDLSSSRLVERLMIALAGPWWIFVGYVVFQAYSGNSCCALTFNGLDGKNSLALFSLVTLLAFIVVRELEKTVRWIVKGEQ